MNAQEIEMLLNKYLDAETSLKEESILRDYFNNNNVETSLQPYKLMFTHFNVTETYNKPIFKRNWSWMNIAASFILLIGLTMGYNAKQNYDTQIAYNQTEAAFNLLGNNLNKGAESLAYIGEFNKATNKIFKQ
tara:strand:- start:10020 stop:10418 length:399 start_codon:yes stop_codon:yes gene_type:complete